MNTPTPASTDWPRPYWTPGQDERAVLLFFVFGRFDAGLRIPAGNGGLPRGTQVRRQTHADLAQWQGYPLGGALGEVLAEDHSTAFAAAREMPDVLTVRGRFDDPDSLNYLRDSIDTLSRLFDLGATTIIDPQILSLFDAERWRERFLVAGGAPPRAHVLILANREDTGTTWVRTRGMRKFARPDISIHGIPQADVEHAGALCERLVEMQAMGGHFDDGQTLEIEELPGTLALSLGGDMDDPKFNNTHVAMQWPR